MIVTVTATTTNGMPLPEDKLAKVFEAVDMMMDLEAARKKVTIIDDI